MEKTHTYVGLDVHENSISAAIADGGLRGEARVGAGETGGGSRPAEQHGPDHDDEDVGGGGLENAPVVFAEAA
jgi:hypothetical protein